VSNTKEAVAWLEYTYLYVRMMRNPSLYGVTVDMLEQDPLLEQYRLNLVHSAAIVLDRAGLIHYDRKTGAYCVLCVYESVYCDRNQSVSRVLFCVCVCV
jgi:pre-mRNA-splicing helicase BRR2